MISIFHDNHYFLSIFRNVILLASSGYDKNMLTNEAKSVNKALPITFCDP